MKEEWRTVVMDDKENPWYSVSNFGNVRSHLQKKRLGKGFYVSYNPNYYNDLSLFKSKNRDGSLSCMKTTLQFPDDFFEDYQYTKRRQNNDTVQKKCSAHELVMRAFRPMDDYPPDRLKDCWNDIPEDAKTWIKQTVTIDHIDHDPSNNRLDNLRYVTQRENSRAAVKHYGGHVSNKNREDDWLKIIDPVFNPLLQEWEDGEIEFIGPEGEKYYKMLENIARDSGKPINEIYVSAIKRFYDKMKKEESEIK